MLTESEIRHTTTIKLEELEEAIKDELDRRYGGDDAEQVIAHDQKDGDKN